MRRERRIPVILEALKSQENKRKLLEYWFEPPHGTQIEIGDAYSSIEYIIEQWEKYEENLESHWKYSPDWRFSQLLINSGIMRNFPGFYYHKEDETSVIESGILEAKDILFWGNFFDENKKRLDEPRFLLASEMSSSHIKNVLAMHYEDGADIPKDFIRVFEEELKNREK